MDTCNLLVEQKLLLLILEKPYYVYSLFEELEPAKDSFTRGVCFKREFVKVIVQAHVVELIVG